MKPVHRVEVILDATESKAFAELLDHHGISYSLIRNVQGSGGNLGDQLVDVFSAVYFLIACDQEVLDRLLPMIRPMIERFGGVALVSQAQMLIKKPSPGGDGLL